MYDAFNARNVDATLAQTNPALDWPNGWEGGREHGHDAVREYWLRQWAEIDPHVNPVSITRLDDGRVDVAVHQVVRDLAGNLLSDGHVHHIYRLDDNGLIARMDIVDAG